MPVGRYVLDVHGESRDTWPASDAVCAALQINNHLQDCKSDYLALDRVYVPLDALTSFGTSVEAIGGREASPALRACLRSIADRTAALLRDGAGLPDQIRDLRLSLEISVIHTLAERIVQMLALRDPLSERVHLGKAAFARIGLIGIMKGLGRRMTRRPAIVTEHQGA
jgi:phytoene/squalene synthetase